MADWIPPRVFLPPGGHHDIHPPYISREMLRESWDCDPDTREVNGISAEECGISAVVRWFSPLKLREAVECVAYYFRREITDGMLQFSSVEEDDDYRAYLWTDPNTLDRKGRVRVIGATCFRWREYTNAPPAWGWQWMWIHPYERHKKILTNAWPYLQQRLQRIIPEPPFSPAMEAFLRKQKHWPFEE